MNLSFSLRPAVNFNLNFIWSNLYHFKMRSEIKIAKIQFCLDVDINIKRVLEMLCAVSLLSVWCLTTTTCSVWHVVCARQRLYKLEVYINECNNAKHTRISFLKYKSSEIIVIMSHLARFHMKIAVAMRNAFVCLICVSIYAAIYECSTFVSACPRSNEMNK